MYFKELAHVEADRSEIFRLKTKARVDVAGLSLKTVKAQNFFFVEKGQKVDRVLSSFSESLLLNQ